MNRFTPPRRIAFCITELDPGGAERALVQLVTRLDRAEWTPKVFCLSGQGELIPELEAAEIPVECFDARGSRDLSVLPRLGRALRRFQPALLQTWLFHANLLGRLAGRAAGVPVIVSGIRVAERRARWRLWADRLTQRLVRAHVCVSQDVARFSIQQGGLEAHRMHVIPNGVEAQRFAQAIPRDRSEFGIPSEAKIVLFVGRLDHQKDPLRLLHALAEVQKSLSNVHLLMVGQGPLRHVIDQTIHELNLTPRVRCLGWRNDVPELMRASDVFVLPSRWEGMANALLEAMAAGLPVVATAVEGTSELVEDKITGRLISPGDSESLAQAIIEVLTNPTLATQWGISAQHLVFQKFTWEENARSYQSLYLQLLQEFLN